jgi:hypothetical protein
MKRYIVYVEKVDGTVDHYQCFAKSKEQAQEKVKYTWKDIKKAVAFDYFIQL